VIDDESMNQRNKATLVSRWFLSTMIGLVAIFSLTLSVAFPSNENSKSIFWAALVALAVGILLMKSSMNGNSRIGGSTQEMGLSGGIFSWLFSIALFLGGAAATIMSILLMLTVHWVFILAVIVGILLSFLGLRGLIKGFRALTKVTEENHAEKNAQDDSDSVAGQLDKLNALRKSGALTEQEYAKAKARILG
jgi:MFS family permease